MRVGSRQRRRRENESGWSGVYFVEKMTCPRVRTRIFGYAEILWRTKVDAPQNHGILWRT